MGKGIKVKINQAAWGQQVMASPEMQSYLKSLGSQVASKLPGGSVDVTVSRTIRGGGKRARATITTDIPMQDEADNGTALQALQSVIGSAHAPKQTRAYKRRAAKREERKG